MPEIAHTLPACIGVADGTSVASVRPGRQVVPFASGPVRTRARLARSLRQYELKPARLTSADHLEQWQAYLEHVALGGVVAWVPEVLSGTHRDLRCLPFTDGSRTTFVLPVVAPTGVQVFAGGVPVDSSDYTVHSTSNVLDEDEATCEDVGLWTGQAADLSILPTISADGIAGSLEVVASAGNATAYLTDWKTGLTVGDVYTSAVAVLNADTVTHSMQALTYWYAGTSFISTKFGTAVDVAPGEWVVLTATGAAPATCDSARPAACMIDSISGDTYFFGAASFGPGDYDRWHLPPQAPGLIEFDSAPAADRLVTAAATGKRITPCALEPGSSWSTSSRGHALLQSIRAIEVPSW